MRDLEPIAALTGAAGTGKTVSLNTALARCESAGDRVIRVNNFVAGPLSLHRMMAASLGVMDASELSAEALEPVLRKALTDAGQSEPPVLAVDDAQSLLPETLRYLCLLAGLREAGRPLFRILLVGRPGFTVRQSIPVQFALESMRADDARQLVQHGLRAAGVNASDNAIQDIVLHAQGNLRKLDTLLRASIQQGERPGPSGGSRRPITSENVQIAAGGRIRPRRQISRRRLNPWLAVPAAAVVGVAGLAAFHYTGLPNNPIPHANQTIAPAEVPPRAASNAALPAMPTQSPAPAPVVIAPPVALTTNMPPPHPGQAAGGVPPAAENSGSSQPQASVPVPQAVIPAPAPAEGDAARTSAFKPMVAPAPQAPASEIPAPQAPAPRAIASDGPRPQSPGTGNAIIQGTHFRVYNVGPCHRGICTRWTVIDLDHDNMRFAAGFDPLPLNLDRGSMQKVREGRLDLIVVGAVTPGGPNGHVLTADVLQAVAAHRGRLQSQPEEQQQQEVEPASEPASGSAPIALAPPPTQSPPPGFLTLPGVHPAAEAPPR